MELNLYGSVYPDIRRVLDYWSDRGRTNADHVLRDFSGLIVSYILVILLVLPQIVLGLYCLVRWLAKKREPEYSLNQLARKKSAGK